MKKLIVLALIVIITIGLVPTELSISTAALKFKDVKDSDYFANGVYKLVDKGAISGYGNGNFGANDSMTRSQYIKTVIAATVGTQARGDASKGQHLLENYMNKAYELGIVTKMEFMKSTWDQPITREDMAKVLVRTMTNVLHETKSTDYKEYEGVLTDIGQYTNEYKDFILQAYAKGLIAGYVNGNFGGKDNMIRAQACATILRMIDKSERVTPKKPDPAIAGIWSDAEFEKYMNGLMDGTDKTLADCVYNDNDMGISRVENGKIYMIKVGNSNARELMQETEIKDLNGIVYNACKNLVYNAYKKGCSVYFDMEPPSAWYQANTLKISYKHKPASMIKTNSDSPRLNPDWSLTIAPYKGQELLWQDIPGYGDRKPQEKAKMENMSKAVKDQNLHYHFYWMVNGLCTQEFADLIHQKLPIVDGKYYDKTGQTNYIQEEHGKTLKEFMIDIYGSENGNKVYKHTVDTISKYHKNYYLPSIANSFAYSLFTVNSNIGTPFRVMTGAESGLTYSVRVWTDY